MNDCYYDCDCDYDCDYYYDYDCDYEMCLLKLYDTCTQVDWLDCSGRVLSALRGTR